MSSEFVICSCLRESVPCLFYSVNTKYLQCYLDGLKLASVPGPVQNVKDERVSASADKQHNSANVNFSTQVETPPYPAREQVKHLSLVPLASLVAQPPLVVCKPISDRKKEKREETNIHQAPGISYQTPALIETRTKISLKEMFECHSNVLRSVLSPELYRRMSATIELVGTKNLPLYEITKVKLSILNIVKHWK